MTETFNLDAERTVLGAVLVDNSAIARVMSKLSADDFYRPGHQVVYKAMVSLFERSAAIDFITLRSELGKDLERAGGIAYVASLADGVPKITNVEDWCAIVRDKSARRRLKFAAAEIDALCDEDEDVSVVLDAALTKVLDVSHKASAGTGYHAPADTAKAAVQKLDLLSKTGIAGLQTGLKEFDAVTNGLRAPQLIVVAGRPGMGKSAWASTIARNLALQGKVVGFVSLEMDHDEIGIRLLCNESGVTQHKLKTTPESWGKISSAYAKMATLPIYIDDDPYLSLSKIMARTRQLQAEHGLDILIIDYLQLIHSDKAQKWGGRQEEIAGIARGLKAMAKSLAVPVVALSQLSRKVEERDDKRPNLGDLRESGEIEQAADIVVFLYRPCVYDPSADHTKAQIIIAKHRNGTVGPLNGFRYDRGRTAFINEGEPTAAELDMKRSAA